MTETKEIRDYRGTVYTPFSRPVRVVSLVPSITELLFDLGLGEDEVVGRTRFCIHPEDRVQEVPSVGGTKDFKIQRIVMHNPDLVIANVDENRRDDIDLLESVYPQGKVFVTHPNTFNGALQMIRDLGILLDADDRGEEITAEITALRDKLAARTRKRVLYMIWMKPFMTVAPGTFIHDMLRQSGSINCLDEEWVKSKHFASEGRARYPDLTLEEIAELRPEEILLSSEPYPFKEKHVRYLRRQISRIDKDFAAQLTIRCVDGELYSWYGSRMLHAMRAFAEEG